MVMLGEMEGGLLHDHSYDNGLAILATTGSIGGDRHSFSS